MAKTIKPIKPRIIHHKRKKQLTIRNNSQQWTAHRTVTVPRPMQFPPKISWREWKPEPVPPVVSDLSSRIWRPSWWLSWATRSRASSWQVLGSWFDGAWFLHEEIDKYKQFHKWIYHIVGKGSDLRSSVWFPGWNRDRQGNRVEQLVARRIGNQLVFTGSVGDTTWDHLGAQPTLLSC